MGIRLLLGALLLLSLGSAGATSVAEDRDVRPIRVAVFKGRGVGPSVDPLLNVLRQSPRVAVERITAEQVCDGHLSRHEVIIHPGGSGSGQAKALGEPGRARVREFVAGGGGFIGICAGAYLASSDYDWSLHILDAKVLDRKHWARGFGSVQLEVTPAGRELFDAHEVITVYYHQGPLLAPADHPEVPDYELLASFKTEIAKNGAPKGVMIGTAAAARGRFGKGRVLCFSPHPEKTDGLEMMVHRAVLWTVDR